MRISAKARYALASMIHLGQNYNNGENVTVVSISERLGISKIYLEQVFSLLKRGSLVNSVKGAQGGYQLTRAPQKITVLEIMFAVEVSLFEQTETTVPEKAPEVDKAMVHLIFQSLDSVVRNRLQKITLADLVTEVEHSKSDQALMYFI